MCSFIASALLFTYINSFQKSATSMESLQKFIVSCLFTFTVGVAIAPVLPFVAYYINYDQFLFLYVQTAAVIAIFISLVIMTRCSADGQTIYTGSIALCTIIWSIIAYYLSPPSTPPIVHVFMLSVYYVKAVYIMLTAQYLIDKIETQRQSDVYVHAISLYSNIIDIIVFLLSSGLGTVFGHSDKATLHSVQQKSVVEVTRELHTGSVTPSPVISHSFGNVPVLTAPMNTPCTPAAHVCPCGANCPCKNCACNQIHTSSSYQVFNTPTIAATDAVSRSRTQ